MFSPGDSVIFDPSTFNPSYWDNLPESERLRYYGVLGYGEKLPRVFTFLCEHSPQLGHCVLIDMRTQRVETMRHICNFRLATDEDC